MTAESLRTHTNPKTEISYGWFEAKPYSQGGVYFSKLNNFLEKETYAQRWWIVKHKDTGRTYAQGLWTPREAQDFVKKIKWNSGQFYLPKESYSISYSLGDAIYSCKTSGVLVRDLVREKILVRRDSKDGLIEYFPRLSPYEKFISKIRCDKPYTVKIRQIFEEPGRVWFDLKTPINL